MSGTDDAISEEATLFCITSSMKQREGRHGEAKYMKPHFQAISDCTTFSDLLKTTIAKHFPPLCSLDLLHRLKENVKCSKFTS